MRYREHHPLLLPTGDVVAVALLALALLVGLVLTDPQGRGLPGSFGGGVAEDFLWAVEPGPLDPFAVGDADTLRQTVAAAQAVIDDAHHFDFGVSLVATFPTAAEAAGRERPIEQLLRDAARWYAAPANEAAAAALVADDAIAPLTDPERDALDDAGIEPGVRGSGWGGAPVDADAAVFAIDTRLVVVGLKSDAMIEDDPPPPIPLVQLVERAGADVLLEGDRSGEGAIVLDASCRAPDDAVGAALVAGSEEAFETAYPYFAIPPWVRAATPEEAFARQTLRAWTSASIRAMDDPRALAILDRYAAASVGDYPALNDELAELVAELTPELVEGPVDEALLRLLAARDSIAPSGEERAAHNAAIGARLGAYPTTDASIPAGDAYDTLPQYGLVRFEGGRVEIGWVSIRFSVGGLQLLAWLVDHGCADLRVRLTDHDAVRVD